ncbi:hypothetical protein PO909_011671 [Leuciscus waleckii]
MLRLSASEEVDVLSIEAGEMEDSPPHPPAYEELLEVVTHAVAKLNISWPCERQEAHKKSKLDECFLQPLSQPPAGVYHSFPTCIMSYASSLSSPSVLQYSNILGAKENGYGMMAQIEEPLARYLSPDVASSLKAPVLPAKPCQTTFDLVGRAYMVAGQTDLIKDLEGHI